MEPAKPPLPTPSSLSFHPASGSQTSKRMFESLVGLMTPATRQNAGRRSITLPYGVSNLPAGIDCAVVMAVSFSFKAERLSQLVACAAGAASEGASTRRQAVTIRIVASLSVARDVVSIMRHKDDRPASFRSAQSPLLYTESAWSYFSISSGCQSPFCWSPGG